MDLCRNWTANSGPNMAVFNTFDFQILKTNRFDTFAMFNFQKWPESLTLFMSKSLKRVLTFLGSWTAKSGPNLEPVSFFTLLTSKAWKHNAFWRIFWIWTAKRALNPSARHTFDFQIVKARCCSNFQKWSQNGSLEHCSRPNHENTLCFDTFTTFNFQKPPMPDSF